MFSKFVRNIHLTCLKRKLLTTIVEVPKSCDVVIIGGGSAGCHLFYFLSKFGLKTLLIERGRVTCGTTWHTAGLIWSLKNNPIDIQLLLQSRKLIENLEKETGIDPGWIKNGSLFIAHSTERLEEYKLTSSLGRALGVDSQILDKSQTKTIHPFLNEDEFVGALYCPNDGSIDPSMLCTALTKTAIKNGSTLIENCEVMDILVNRKNKDNQKIVGVQTNRGIVHTNVVVNAAGVWANDLLKPLNIRIPITSLRHSYVVTNSIPGIRNLPHVRDHDLEIYFRVQGDSICFGGYETNPTLISNVPKDFQFGLYEMNWNTFEPLAQSAVKLMPQLAESGIKSTISGPEAFTPDRKPILGPDIRIDNLFHSCGYSSAGMMFGGGCAEQLAHWIINGLPNIFMYNYDLNRFKLSDIYDTESTNAQCLISYAKNYQISSVNSLPINLTGIDTIYKKNEITDNFDSQIKYEIKIANSEGIIFDLSHASKICIEGEDVHKAMDWIFTAHIDSKINKVIPSCALNKCGGIELTATITKISDNTFYIISYDCPRQYMLSHIIQCINEKQFRVKIQDVSEQFGILVIYNLKSINFLQKFIDQDLLSVCHNYQFYNAKFHFENNNSATKIKTFRRTLIGKIAYEFHISWTNFQQIKSILEKTIKIGAIETYYALSHEDNHLVWGHDVTSIETPIEAKLLALCRANGNYKGADIIQTQYQNESRKQLVGFISNANNMPLIGLEGIYNNGKPVGYLRRSGYATSLQKYYGRGYIENANNTTLVDNKYQIDVRGKLIHVDIARTTNKIV